MKYDLIFSHATIDTAIDLTYEADGSGDEMETSSAGPARLLQSSLQDVGLDGVYGREHLASFRRWLNMTKGLEEENKAEYTLPVNRWVTEELLRPQFFLLSSIL